LQPFTVISDNKLIFLTWFLFTVFAGQIGVFSNFIIRVLNGNLSFSQSLYLDSSNGSFYTYSIALLASVIGPLFVNIIEKHPTSFKAIKILTIIISIFTLFFAGVFYTSSSNNNGFELSNIVDYNVDWWQMSFLIISIFLAVYSFSVLRLENNPQKYQELADNYSRRDNEQVDNLNIDSENLNVDSKGNQL